MKKFFWIGLLGWLLFELANVYFIMPMPGSQRLNSIDLAYFLYSHRWIFRIVFGVLLLAGYVGAAWKRKWIPWLMVMAVAGCSYLLNFNMAADAMFQQPNQMLFLQAAKNTIDRKRLVLGVAINGAAKAYPIKLLGYHHHLQDTVGGKAILVTYCTVCRTGRVFDPVINGKRENFRLVGMDHFNALLEDATTKSWWRQATGEAITGKRKGTVLNEIKFVQTSLATWLILYPQSTILQPDPSFMQQYGTGFNYENGTSKSKLTGTDSISWNPKSWIIGIKKGTEARAYDWNQLRNKRWIQDQWNDKTILVVLATDEKSFFAFELPATEKQVRLDGDTIFIQGKQFALNGTGMDTTGILPAIPAYQEFWHSWKTFQPHTRKVD